jgi:hypothetical protein
MKANNSIMRKLSIAIAAVILFITACKKTEDLGQAPRLFRPTVAGQLLSDSNTIMAGWQKINGASTYEFQLSKDTFKTIDLTMKLDTNAVVLKNLYFNQLYQIQVRAIASDTTFNSRWSFLGSVKTQTSILQVPGVSEITDIAVRATWTPKGAPVTALKIIKRPDSSVVSQVNLTATDVANKFKIISGLTPNTTYTMYMYSGTDVRGWVDFTTKAPETGTIIDLRDITGRPSVLADTLPVVPAGSKILLKRGETYNIASALSLSKGVVIKSGDDLSTTAQATIYFTSNFNFAAGSTIDLIEFNDVYMRSDNYGSRYVFNTTGSATVGKIKFENAKIEIFRGIARLQSGTTTVTDFVVNNCIVDSLANYGVLTVDNTTCKAENVSITNSTIYKAERIIVSKTNSTSVLIDNCTINETPLGSLVTGSGFNYYVNYNANTVTNGISITNNIFGPGKANATGDRAVKAVNAAAGTTINASNNYKTSDYVAALNGDLQDIILYPKPSTQLWTDPFNGNFKIADKTFPGLNTTGDPRWR